MWLVILLATLLPAAAQGGGLTLGSAAREYPYPSEPQYQYPVTERAKKCPKGQAPYQGKCRVVRAVH
jgi:hypothetical protein